MNNSLNPLPRLAAIHDLSGYGRCSLTVIMPILSTMGFEVCPLPTAVLSTHTEMEGFILLDLTEQLPSFIDHWKKMDLKFEAIYSGFLGSAAQVDLVVDFIDHFRTPETLVVVDPVMADNGKLYPSMPPEMIGQMRKLTRKAQVVTPNMTEAAFILDRPVPEKITCEETKEWLLALAELAEVPVITSLPLAGSEPLCVVAAYDRADGRFWMTGRKAIPARYHGTGDIFSSVLTGSLMQGDSLPIALDRSAQFVATAIRSTFGYHHLGHNEILLERALSTLTMPVIDSAYELL